MIVNESQSIGSKRDEYSFKLTDFWIQLQYYCTSWVRMLDFFTIFWKIFISFFMSEMGGEKDHRLRE